MIKYHFMNVGHGDTTIIELPDSSLMVVDFNRDNDFDEDTAKELSEIYKINFEDLKKQGKGYYQALSKYYDIALDDPLSYLKENFDYSTIFRYVQTHPDLDHFAGFKALTTEYTITNFWDTDHKNITKDDFANDSDKEDWEHYLEFRKNQKNIFYRSAQAIINQNQTYPYKIYVFHPTKEALEVGDSKDTPQPNFFSYLILLEYNGFKTVLGGDVTEAYWKDLWLWLEENQEIKKFFQNIHVLKASHHGRKSGRCGWEEGGAYNRDFLNWMNPEFVIISVGEKPENSDATEWYRRRPDKSSRNVLTTRWYGTIWASYDGSIPFSNKNILIETRYDRKDTNNSHIQKLETVFLPTSYNFKLGAKISSLQNGSFKEEYKSNGRSLPKNMWLKFYIKNSNIPEPYLLKWRVVNTGKEAREANGLRGSIEEDKGFKTKKERTLYKGTHYVDCYAIKNGSCVAEDRFFVNIK